MARDQQRYGEGERASGILFPPFLLFRGDLQYLRRPRPPVVLGTNDAKGHCAAAPHNPPLSLTPSFERALAPQCPHSHCPQRRRRFRGGQEEETLSPSPSMSLTPAGIVEGAHWAPKCSIVRLRPSQSLLLFSPLSLSLAPSALLMSPNRIGL